MIFLTTASEKKMVNQNLIKELFNPEIEELSQCIFHSDTIIESDIWIALENRVESNPPTRTSTLDATNDGTCLFFSNLKRTLNHLEEAVAAFINSDEFQKKLSSTHLDYSEAEEILGNILIETAQQNSDKLVAELDSLDFPKELATTSVDFQNTELLNFHAASLSVSEIAIETNELALSLGETTDQTLSDFTLDSEGALLLDDLKSIIPDETATPPAR